MGPEEGGCNERPEHHQRGDDWREWDPALRATRDRAQARREEWARARVKALTSRAPSTFEPLAVQPLHPVADIGPLYYQPRRHQDAASSTRSRNLDALLAKHGIRPR